MKRLTGFWRCLVYRFDEQDDGEVIAESLDPGSSPPRTTPTWRCGSTCAA
jgi:hypothetical protein